MGHTVYQPKYRVSKKSRTIGILKFCINMVPCQNIFGKNKKQEPKQSHVNDSLRLSRRIFEIKIVFTTLEENCLIMVFVVGRMRRVF